MFKAARTRTFLVASVLASVVSSATSSEASGSRSWDAAAKTVRVNVSSSEAQATRGTRSQTPDISGDGRFVVFQSFASNLVPEDGNASADIFVRDVVQGTTEIVSVSTEGRQGADSYVAPSISDDGRFVAFASEAPLVRNDTNDLADVFVRDRSEGTTTRVSVGPRGRQANDASYVPVISADGRFVAFTSSASNLGRKEDTNSTADVFVHDRSTITTARVSVTWTGEEANRESLFAAISADGRFVAFTSEATNLNRAGDTNNAKDVFVRDREARTTIRVSVSWGGRQANGESFSTYSPGLSADGRFVAFASSATNLNRLGDRNARADVFIRDRAAKTTIRVSVTSSGSEANGGSVAPDVSDDGRFVAFSSEATNLTGSQDTNQALDVFVRDRVARTTSLASVSSTGSQGNGASGESDVVAISSNGRFVTFDSDASNLVANDSNRVTDVFLRGPLG